MFYKKFSKIVIVSIIVVLTIVVTRLSLWDQNFNGNSLSNQPLTAVPSDHNHPEIFNISSLYSPYAILVEQNSGRILYQKNAYTRAYPASLTKMMTAFISINRLHNLQEKITLPDSLFEHLQDSDASMAGFKPGERVRLIDLLYGTMLPSGADAANGLARAVAGSEPAFVRLMNAEANKIGMTHTHFTNCTGLQNNDHYSTASDLALLMRHALRSATFRKLITASQYKVEPTNAHPQGLLLQSTLNVDARTFGLNRNCILGGKTGYTEEAGLCLASIARIRGRDYILVTLDASGSRQTAPRDIEDAIHVYESISHRS